MLSLLSSLPYAEGMSDEDWTREDPIDAEADAWADSLDARTGIAEPKEPRGSFLSTVLFPLLIGGVVLLFGFWWACGKLGLF